SVGVKGGFCGVKENAAYIHTTYRDNIDNLAESFIEQVQKLKEKNLKKYLHVVEGEWSDGDSEQALWTTDTLNALRVESVPELKRIIIAIDPAVTSKDTSDESGLIAAGEGFDGHMYV